MTPKFDNLARLLMEVESPEERAARIKDIESRGYGKSKRIIRDRRGSRPPRVDVDDGHTERKPRIVKVDIDRDRPLEPQKPYQYPDKVLPRSPREGWPAWWKREEKREAGKRTAPHRTNKERDDRARELRGEREEAKRRREEWWSIRVADVKRRAEELGINTQGMTIREIFDKVEYKEFAKYMAEREEQK